MIMNQYEGLGLTEGLVIFRFVETEEEYHDVLELRFKEYSAAGKVAANRTTIDMADPLDRRSKIIIGLYRGEIVASIRMILHEETDRLEQEHYIEWPRTAPRRDQLVEATRACVRRDFRGTDLFLSMLTFFGQEAMKRNKKFVVLCASDEMVGFYRRAGARPMGLSYAHTALNGKAHHVLVVNIAKVFLGEGVNPLSWNLTWGKIYADPKYRCGIRISPLDRLRVLVYTLLRRPAQHYLKRRLRRNFISGKTMRTPANSHWKAAHESA